MIKKFFEKYKLTPKSILRVTTALIVVFIILFISKKVFIISAQHNFDSGKYEKSAKQYLFLLSLDPDEKAYKLKYADSLLNMPFNYHTQELICNFLELYPNDSFTYSLREKLRRFKSNMDNKIGPNYIDKVPYQDQILRWEDDAFPLKVHIDADNQEYIDIVKRAFNYWTYATGNFVSFIYVDKDQNANIIISVLDNAKSNCPNGGCYYAAALTSPEVKNNILQRMNMILYTKDPNGRPYSSDKLYRTTLHEIGHTLGIMGHSDNPQDLMYSSGQHADSIYFAEYRNAISRQDFNTLNYLYMIVPNVSNIPKNKHKTENKIHPNVILGTTKEIQERNIQNAISYIQNAPNLSIGYLELGNAYMQAEMYDKAMKTYKQGFDLSTDNQEKYLFVYNMSILCLKMGDRDKALEYALYAQKLNPTDEIAKYIHDIRYPFSVGNSRI